MSEVACEPYETCNNDQLAFKALAAQWIGATLRIAPNNAGSLPDNLRSSAQAATRQCSGGKNRTACGTAWTLPKSNGEYGLGQELSAMNVVLANLAINNTGMPNTTVFDQSTSPSSTQGSASSLTGTPALISQPTGSGSASSRRLVAGDVVLYALLAATLSFMSL